MLNARLVSAHTNRPYVGERGSLPHSHLAPHYSPFKLKARRSFPLPLGVSQTWEAPQELLRDPETHKSLLPQSALSSSQCVY